MEKRKSPPTNFKSAVTNIEDSYKREVADIPGINPNTWIAHALQKDAIQNSIDAIDKNNKENWGVTITIDRLNRPTFLAVEDHGTLGLGGPVVDINSLEEKDRAVARWAKFEGYLYGNPEKSARGARGQGKLIFLLSSNNQRIVYETFLKDGTHRLGEWDNNKSPELLDQPKQEKDADDYIQNKFPGLSLLRTIGTRIIIENPSESVWKAFQPLNSCDIKNYISTTWWELLENGGKINIKVLKNEENQERSESIVPPDEYKSVLKSKLDTYESDELIYLRIKNKEIDNKNFNGCKIKELCIAWSKRELPALLRGISIQRGQMQVEMFNPRTGNDNIPSELCKHIFGWVIFNSAADEQIKGDESPTHYVFNKMHGSIAREILGENGLLSKEVKKFAERYFNITENRTETTRHRNVLNRINKLAKNLGYNKYTRSTQPHEERGERGEITITLSEPRKSSNSERLSFGDEISEIKAKLNNYGDKTRKLSFRFCLKRSEAVSAIYEDIKKTFVDKEITVRYKSNSGEFGPFSIILSKDEFPTGRYLLEARAVSLNEDETKSEILAFAQRSIYLEIDPPAERGGLFKDIEYPPFFGENKNRRFKIDQREDGIYLQLNKEYKLYKRAEEMTKLLSNKKIKLNPDPVQEYEFDSAIIALLQWDLIDGEGKLLTFGSLNKDIKFKDARKNDPNYDAIIKSFLSLEQELLDRD